MAGWFITGIGSGLGRALAQAALDRGDKVVGTTRKTADIAAFEALKPGLAKGLAVDLRDADAVTAAVAEAENWLGGIDFAVNNAGFGMVGAIEEVSLSEVQALFEINVFAAIRVIQAVLPGMRARRAGHVVNITSVSGLAPWAGTGIYGASKYALECIGQTLAQEVRPLGIGVTNVAPGGFRTGFAAGGLAVAARKIADYDGSAHVAEQVLTGNAGKEKGDPVRGAAAILAALDSPEPPLHLLLGEDALHYAEDQFAFIGLEMKRWRALSLSTAFEAA
ncbi:SDR family NAD(P)-dependent oxidoreductase [Sandaracinobacter neustonicus]|uniref:SDR family NAD(P)-dependent oxidoreductase n=1 Tax=Sandaracinobacter neustonicus TaxID=1715348 RepID=A0A501XNF5_9SPHN|nr:oxidoreductase [Sandaracinobacter neustonicus]TPE62202.1 SDR family NAD(P)-dependent oxidoreductase [Sandaracinobacter neustonicus]